MDTFVNVQQMLADLAPNLVLALQQQALGGVRQVACAVCAPLGPEVSKGMAFEQMDIQKLQRVMQALSQPKCRRLLQVCLGNTGVQRSVSESWLRQTLQELKKSERKLQPVLRLLSSCKGLLLDLSPDLLRAVQHKAAVLLSSSVSRSKKSCHV